MSGSLLVVQRPAAAKDVEAGSEPEVWIETPAGVTEPNGQPRRRIASDWLALLNPAEIARLAETGCLFGSDDLAMVRRLRRRGFTPRDIVAAYRALRRLPAASVHHLEAIAVFMALNLHLDGLESYVRSGRTLTDWYNRRHLGGQDLQKAGWALVGAAAGFLVGTAVLSGFVARLAYRDWAKRCEPDCYSDFPGLSYYIAGIGLTIPASILLGIGVPLGVVGEVRRRRWLRDRVLDRGSASDIAAIRRKGRKPLSTRHGVTWAVTPQILPGGGGVSFQLRF